MTRRYFYDTEFIEDGVTIDLISIGIVGDDGREYYAVNHNAPWDRIEQRPWLVANVVPSLPPIAPAYRDVTDRPSDRLGINLDHSTVKPRLTIAAEVRNFLLQPNEPFELWGYFPSYDHVVLAQLYGTMIDLPRGFPQRTNDVQQEAERLGLDHSFPAQAGTEHNALDDARWTHAAWKYLRGAESRRLHRRRPTTGQAMPRVIHEPDQHNCHKALAELLKTKPLGTVVECDCTKRYRLDHEQRDGRYWKSVSVDTNR